MEDLEEGTEAEEYGQKRRGISTVVFWEFTLIISERILPVYNQKRLQEVSEVFSNNRSVIRGQNKPLALSFRYCVILLYKDKRRRRIFTEEVLEKPADCVCVKRPLFPLALFYFSLDGP